MPSVQVAVLQIACLGPSQSPVVRTGLILDSLWFDTAGNWRTSSRGAIAGDEGGSPAQTWSAEKRPNTSGKADIHCCNPSNDVRVEIWNVREPISAGQRGTGFVNSQSKGSMAQGDIAWLVLSAVDIPWEKITDDDLSFVDQCVFT